MIRILRAGCAPTLPDLVASPLKNLIVSRILPQYEILDDLEKALPLFVLRFLSLENIRVRRWIIHHLRKITARAVANGRLAHHKCNVDGCPCRIDFSRAEALLMASSGKATSMSFFL
jgi:hypothetical protein